MLSLIDFAQWNFRLDEVDQQLTDLETREDNIFQTRSLSSGPFTVFYARNDRDCTDSGQDLCNQDPSKFSPLQETQSSEDVLTRILYLDDECIRSSPCSTSNSLHLIRQKSRSPWPNTSPPIFSSQFLELRTGIYQDTLAGYLMDNYVRNVANLLQPIPHPQNSYNSIYVPRAMVGSASLLSGLGVSRTSSQVSASNVAIFYSLLATSAFHLRGSDLNSKFDELARGFRFKATTNLRKAIQELPSSQENAAETSLSVFSQRHEGTLAAMLTLVTADVTFP